MNSNKTDIKNLNCIDKIRHEILINYIKRIPILSFVDGFYIGNDNFEKTNDYKKIMNLDEAFIFFKNYVRSVKS